MLKVQWSMYNSSNIKCRHIFLSDIHQLCGVQDVEKKVHRYVIYRVNRSIRDMLFIQFNPLRTLNMRLETFD